MTCPAAVAGGAPSPQTRAGHRVMSDAPARSGFERSPTRVSGARRPVSTAAPRFNSSHRTRPRELDASSSVAASFDAARGCRRQRRGCDRGGPRSHATVVALANDRGLVLGHADRAARGLTASIAAAHGARADPRRPHTVVVADARALLEVDVAPGLERPIASPCPIVAIVRRRREGSFA